RCASPLLLIVSFPVPARSSPQSWRRNRDDLFSFRTCHQNEPAGGCWNTSVLGGSSIWTCVWAKERAPPSLWVSSRLLSACIKKWQLSNRRLFLGADKRRL